MRIVPGRPVRPSGDVMRSSGAAWSANDAAGSAVVIATSASRRADLLRAGYRAAIRR